MNFNLRHTLSALLLAAVFSPSFLAQQPTPPKAEPPVAPTSEQQQRFAAAQGEAELALKEWKATGDRADSLPAGSSMSDRIRALGDIVNAQRRYDLAGAELRFTVVYIMAKLKLDPDEYDARIADGRLVFTRKAPPPSK